jgi:subtilisin family serine protease
MGHRVLRAAVCVTLAALGSSLASTAAFGATPEVVAPGPPSSPTGTYIVLLDDAPAATYEGGMAGLTSTAAGEGEKLDTHAARVQKYAAFLEARQRELAAEAGVEPLATYQIVLNGFSAQLTPDAAARVAAIEGVLAVYPDEVLRPDATLRSESTPPHELGDVAAPSAIAAGGGGVVVGLIDTGIAPDNPSFGGERLGSASGAEPYLDGNEVVFEKADGREFRSTRVSADDWQRSDYSSKLVAAQFFAAGAVAAGFDFAHDVLSPRDRDGHGSRVAGVAAGDGAVDVEIDGVDFGAISGAAPDARIASYKACFSGGDALSSADDICAASDVLAALDRAVQDGVDVVSYSLGGADPGWGPDDIALYNAAAAGVFVAASAGNDGPGASTVQAGAPWYTTVAASTAPTFAATVRLSDGFEAPGVSASVRAGRGVSAPVVLAADAARDGAADANLCYPDTLDPALAAGRIVVCDRGTNPRAEKAHEVADVGGIGMILVNVDPDSVDAELDAIPTIHLDAASREGLLAAVESGGVTATLTAGELTGDAIPTPQIAGFSGRGPLGDGEVLTPDVAAPGVGILAAVQDTSAGEPAWGIASGTSLAAPHIAGLAAVYLAAHPDATPDEIKSALMTTAYDTVNADGSAGIDPFAQGAGHVDAERVLDPGLLYLSGPAQWQGFLQQHGRAPLEAVGQTGDVNLASISVPALGRKSTVTRTLTATRAGTYEAAASIPGIDVTVSPATLTFTAPGDTQRFTVAFANDTAPAELWATGFLTWTAEDGTTVRSPLAVRPATASGTALVTGQGADGSAGVQFVSGVTGDLELRPAGLAPVELLVDPDDPAPGHSGDAGSGDDAGRIAWVVSVPGGSPLAEFALSASDDSDVGLAVYRLASPDADTFVERWGPTPASGERRVTLVDPTPGSYLVVADLSGAAEDTTFDLTAAVVPGSGSSLTVTPESLPVTAGEEVPYTLAWQGLTPDAEYLGVVRYGDSAARTLVRITAGPGAPVAETPPAVIGRAEVGGQLTVTPGIWQPGDVALSYQWLRDGEPIADAVTSRYRVRSADAGAVLTAQVTARQPGNVNQATALSDPVIVNDGSRVELTMNRSVGTTADQYAVTVAVTTARGEPATGTVAVSVDGTPYVGTLAAGRVTFTLPAQSPGIHVVVAEYSGATGVTGSTGISRFTVRE